MANKNLEPIAVIGIGAVMPGALNKEQFWQNITDGKNCIKEVPADTHWDPALFYSSDRKAADKTYSKIGGFIEGFKFNSLKYRIPPQVAKQMDPVQYLAIETTAMAFEDSGYDKKDFNRDRAAVIIGNAMGGMKGEMSNTRVNKEYFYEIIKNSPSYHTLSPETAQNLLNDLEAGVNRKFMPITEDTMPGELANVIAGRVANVFDLHGTNFTVDAACATSLAAIDQAVNGLRVGNYDMAVCGGVDQMMSPSAFIKFSKIGALSADGSRPFDAKADGFVMAEGAGMLILKRLSDAVKDGDKIYCVIRAVGASSDGKGKGITAPNPKGQKLAVEKTFEQLDYTPGDVGLLEAHGTGTIVGDKVEVTALDECFAPYSKPHTIGLGSVKSQIGHAKAAAGVASFIKTALALHNKVLPPSINFETPNPNVNWETTPFRVITRAEPWNTDKVRRANVSSFGFGGTNFHVALEEYHAGLLGKKPAGSAAQATYSEEKKMDNSYRLLVEGEKLEGDMLVFSGDTKQELFLELGAALKDNAANPKYIPQTAFKNHTKNYKKFAVAINAESSAKLKEKIEFFIKTAGTIDVWTQDSLHLRMKSVYPFHPSDVSYKICFMFPGQGSQYVDMMKDLASKYKVVQDTFNEADGILKSLIGTTLTEVIWSKEGEGKEDYERREQAIRQTQMTQPAVMTADVAMMRLLSSFGIKPEVVMGHSLGEYAAAVAAGIFDFENGLKSVTTRAKAMSNIKVEDPGMMVSVAAPVEKVEPELGKISGYIAVANKNCPTQTVIAGETKAAQSALKMFTEMGIQAVQVPVSHAFHSQIIKPAEGPYREFLNTLTVNPPVIPITSNVTADFYPNDTTKIKDLLVSQLVSSVEWTEQLKRTYDSGVRLFVECGPKRVLSALATSTLEDKKDIKVMASNHPKKGGINEFNDLLANLTASGVKLDWRGTETPAGQDSVLNPAYSAWVSGAQMPQAPVQSAPAAQNFAPQMPVTGGIVISGIAAGTPGSHERLFRENGLDEILAGVNMIEAISPEQQQKQIDKNVEYIIKAKDGNHRVEKLTSIAQAIKLNARGGAFNLEAEFGLPEKWVKSMDVTFQMAIASGILALKDAGIPLVLYYKPTSRGGYLPDRWGLPADMIDDTGVIFTSAFPNLNSIVQEVTETVTARLNQKSRDEIYNFYNTLIGKITDPNLKRELTEWFALNFASYGAGVSAKVFAQDFLLKTIPIAHSHFCQWIRARGPAIAMSGACSSTSQAVNIATDWLKLGRAKRVVIIGADDITNKVTEEWIAAGFLASGAATTEADVTKAALPFDKRRNGMIVGMGAVGMVIEREEDVKARGMRPLAKILETEMRNSAFHPTRLDVNHVAGVMNDMITRAEKDWGLNRAEMAPKTVFISHETYTPARGGSASAEVYALKTTFGPQAYDVIVSNTKGFTGHAMGAGLEDVIAVRTLNTGIVPPIANYKEPDPELAGINLSKGGKYDFKYSLRLAAGFGSQLAMTLLEKMWSVTEPRIFDNGAYVAWLAKASGQQSPVLEVVKNTLRVQDNYVHGQKPALVMEGSQAFVDKVAPAASAPASVRPEPAAQPATAPQSVAQPKPESVAVAPAPAAKPAAKLDENTVRANLINLISEKTGYPTDMLEPDLDMEADLGIDTVKQAELFALIREQYGIPQQEGLQLKDYPTINHIVGFVMNGAGGSAAPAQAATVTTVAAPAPQPVVAPAAAKADLNEASVKTALINLIAEKTGYPTDMLEPDLDMEADLGIDTVKQAELFALIREQYGIPQQEGLQLKDYPTINHIVGFVMNSAGGSAAPVAAPQPVAQPKPVAVAPAPVSTPKAAADLDENSVRENLINLIAEKTGYPTDMLEPDLDMEADLGIDTVKQAELFALIREQYGIPQQEGLQLKDYPTINHIVGFVMNGASAPTPQPAAQPAPESVAVTPAPAPASEPKAAADLDENSVRENLINLIAEKTGYPTDMLEPDLDMEADLGIDTVKQAELFALIREQYGIPQQEGLQLKDYPTINHIVGFVMNGAAPKAAAQQQPAVQTEAPAPQPAAQPAPQQQPAAEPQEYEGQDYDKKKLRYVPTLVAAPLTEKSDRKLSRNRTVLIFSDSSPLTKAYQDELKNYGIKTHVFTTLKARAKNTTIVNWDSLEETDQALREYQRENPGAQGIIYLLGCTVRKFDKKNNPHTELTKYVMPLFTACKVFAKDLSERADADTFIVTNIKIDGSFGYATKEAINPTLGSLQGATQCFRKDMYEVTGAYGKLIDFEAEVSPEEMAEKTLQEMLHGDMRFMVSFKGGERSTILSLPVKLQKDKKRMDLAGKAIAFTGAGRGIGAILSQKIAKQYNSKIIVLDIIEMTEDTPHWARMTEEELQVVKATIWTELKNDPEVKATPVLLEKRFGRVRDAISLYKNLEKLRLYGSEVEYYQCDVTNGSQMKDVVTKIKAKNGRVDGLIHFAGLEHSKLVTDKTAEEFYRIFDVKAVSAAAFLALNLVKDSGFYAYASSIAGKYGNLGQSDYAAANDYLAKLSLSLNNQGMRAISVDMSAYSNTGMGTRAGVAKFLSDNGVKFVDPQDGMQMFLDEIVYGRTPEIVITDCLGQLDWDAQVKHDWEETGEDSDDGSYRGGFSGGGTAEEEPSFPEFETPSEEPARAKVTPHASETENHFLGAVEELLPSQKLLSVKEYSMESDPYLADHAINGTPYVPGVMGAETFMEAGEQLLNRIPEGLEDVHYYLPIKLLRNRPQEVKIKSSSNGDKTEFEIESDFINSKGVKMGDTRRHFTARILNAYDSKWTQLKNKVNVSASVIADRQEIYTKYFHGPSFQVLESINYVNDGDLLAVYQKPSAPLFKDGERKLLAYPMLIEAAFQACGWRDLSVDARMTLPDSIGKLIIHGKGAAPETLYIYGVFHGLSIEGKSMYDAYVFDKNMKLWVELQDYHMIGQ